ncbi:CMGC/CDK/CDK7 protein kinase [Chytriomyces sp. MP71]|nr:CMGC/CDK/CDK7 protein kinase [Chytriomyces sp. MP71]
MSSSYDKYEKQAKIGEGTYAVVYKAGIELSTGRKIAIKKIKKGSFTDGLDPPSIREIKFLKELKHPNVLELIDVFAHKKTMNMILELMETDLEVIIKNKNVVFNAGDVKSWLLMTLRGTYHLHRNFVLHRDLKPNNLFIAADGTLKLGDFGLARDFGACTKPMTNQVVTRWYRAPELLLGGQYYGYGVDMWAIGCIFAELMLRTPYLAGDSDLGQLQIVFHALGTPTEDVWPGFNDLPGKKNMEFVMYPRTPLKTLFTAAGSDALDLLDGMLAYDPLKRISALDALDHCYFRNAPLPTKPEKLPRNVEAPPAVIVEKGLKRKAEDDPLGGAAQKLARKLF